MDPQLDAAIKKYLQQHPEIGRLLEAFQVSQEEYERAIAAMSWRADQPGPAYSSTAKGSFDAHVSTDTR